MNVGDEASSAHLSAKVYGCRKVEAIDPSEATQDLNQVFERWGLPQRIKIDNGHPFVNTNGRDCPTKSMLWWAGLGIDVIQNTPGCPQENGTVECLQGVLDSWSNPSDQENIEALQKEINQQSDFQRNHFKIIAKGRKTRADLYPQLEQNPRKYDPNDFQMQRVFEYLSSKLFKRTIKSKNGIVHIFGEHIYIGRQYIGEQINVTFDPIEHQWLFRLDNGTLLKTSNKAVPVEQEIRSFALGET